MVFEEWTLSAVVPMLCFAILFLVIALISALFGSGLVAGSAYDAAKILFFVFLVLCGLSFLGSGFRQRDIVEDRR